jgi:protein O-mannosyl-transferase
MIQKKPQKSKALPVSRAGNRKSATGGPSIDAAPESSEPNSRWSILAACSTLAILVAIVFGQTVTFDFVNYDDGEYAHENVRITQGLTREGVWSVWMEPHAANWHPLTTLTHMLDCQLYGVWPGGHHLTNVILHAATCVLLFIALKRLTGNFWLSFFAAAIFSIHPLRAESVAWVSERKDVLCGFFGMLTLIAYHAYATQPFSVARYVIVIIVFAMGLMSKPMLVTLPFVLLLLDFWPLRRLKIFGFQGQHDSPDLHTPVSLRLAIAEKLPLLALAVVAAILTAVVQKKIIDNNIDVGAIARLQNAAISYVTYTTQLFWPFNLGVLYLPPKEFSAWRVALSVFILLAITVLSLQSYRRFPHFLVGWLWFLGMLVPVIGFVKVGDQSHADRYTYLPHVGLLIAVVWGLADAIPRWKLRRPLGIACGACVVFILTLLAFQQATIWKNGARLWSRSISINEANYIAQNNLGALLLKNGHHDKAIPHFKKAIAYNPEYADSHSNLGLALAELGQAELAMEYDRKALALNPKLADAHSNLGNELAKINEREEAIEQYKLALEIDDKHVNAHANLAVVYGLEGRIEESIAEYEATLRLSPDHKNANNNLAITLIDQGRPDEAIRYLKHILSLEPENALAHYNLANAYTKTKQPLVAFEHIQAANRLEPNNPVLIYRLARILATSTDASVRNGVKAVTRSKEAIALFKDSVPAEAYETLAAAYAENGQFDQAVKAAEKAIELADSVTQRILIGQLGEQLRRYRRHETWRE